MGGELVDLQGYPITNDSLIFTKFEGVWVEISKATEDGFDPIHKTSTIMEAINYMDNVPMDGETLSAELWVNPDNPTKVDGFENALEIIKTFLQKNLEV